MRTIHQWRRETWWSRVLDEVMHGDAVLKSLKQKSFAVLAKALSAGDVRAACWFLERADQRLTPPRLQPEPGSLDGRAIRAALPDLSEMTDEQLVAEMERDPL